MFANDTHIIGDPAYPLKRNLLVAYKNNGRLTQRQERFNNKLSAARSNIERAFALLKGRFRRLKYLDMHRVDKIPQVIMACCVLHNICLNEGDLFEMQPDLSVDTDSNPAYHTHFVTADDKRAGTDKRNRIADNLNA